MGGEHNPARPAPTGDCLRADGKPKRTYLTKHDAKMAVKASPAAYRLSGELHIYRCPDCRYYHVGHME